MPGPSISLVAKLQAGQFDQILNFPSEFSHNCGSGVTGVVYFLSLFSVIFVLGHA